jgi:hypothetical protein
MFNVTSPLRRFSIQNGRLDRSLSSRSYLIEIAVMRASEKNVLILLMRQNRKPKKSDITTELQYVTLIYYYMVHKHCHTY